MCNDRIYENLLEELRGQIVSRFGSISKFCAEKGVSRQNLTECFQGRQDMSVGLYSRIASSLIAVGESPTTNSSSASLREYLRIDHDQVMKSVIMLSLGEA